METAGDMGGEYAYIYGRGTVKRLLPLVFLLTACANAGTPTLDPRVQVAAMNELDKINATATAMSQGVNNAAFNQSLTQAFIPPALTATALGQHATELANASGAEHATQVAFYNSAAVTFTQQALAVLESDTQRRVSENNRVIADGVRWGEFWHSVLEWGALIIIFAISISATWGVIQFGLFAHVYRKEREKELKRRIDMRIYRDARDEAGSDFLLTSAGPMVRTHAAVTIAERHITDYQRANNWRAVCKTYVKSCIHLEQGGVKHPYSRPNALTYELIQHPATGKAWQMGHDRVISLLRELKVIDNTGKGGITGFAAGIDADNYARVIDTSPFPDFPPDPIPTAKIIVAGWQVSQANAG